MLKFLEPIAEKIGDKADILVEKLDAVIDDKGPAILVGGGLALMAGGAILLAWRSTKLESLTNVVYENIESTREEITEGCATKRDLTLAYMKGLWGYTRLYFLPVGIIVLGGTCVLYGFKMVSSELVETQGVLLATEEAYAAYRKRTRDYVGPEAERMIHYDLHKELVDDGNGGTKEVYVHNDETKKALDEEGKYMDGSASGWIFKWDYDTVRCECFHNDPWNNVKYLQSQLTYLPDKFYKRGYIWLNELLTHIGIKETALSPEGWKYFIWVEKGEPLNVDVMTNGGVWIENITPATATEFSSPYTVSIMDCHYDSGQIARYIRHQRANELPFPDAVESKVTSKDAIQDDLVNKAFETDLYGGKDAPVDAVIDIDEGNIGKKDNA